MLTLLVNFLLIFSCCGNEERPLVQTPLGTIQGHFKTSFKGLKFAAFEGIPYAVPPVGARRFEPPEAVEPWHGTWDGRHPTQCAQIDMFKPEATGDEDCLHINVYTPLEARNLEVVVHIHGGGYTIGWGHMIPGQDFVTDENLIFVTFNYRLGILGFLSTEDEVVPGNNGLKDQVLALKWVQNNIASFGGNPNSVTLTGLSAGAASTHLHYFSEMSTGLYHRGYSQSGAALNPWSLQKNALGKAKLLGESLGCGFSSTEILIECLRQRPFRKIVEKLSIFYGYDIWPIGIFAPVVEKGPDPFLKAHPYDLLQRGEVSNLPWLASTASHEGYMPQIFKEDYDTNWEKIAPFLLDFNYTLDHSKWTSTSKKIREFYCGNSIDEECFTQIVGDRLFQTGVEESVKLQAKSSKSVFYYQFGYPGEAGEKYATHGCDAKYYYGNYVPNANPLTENELKMSEIFLNLLKHFSKTGIPQIEGVDWKPSGSEELTYLNIDSFKIEDMELKTVDQIGDVKFWKTLKLEEGGNSVARKDEL